MIDWALVVMLCGSTLLAGYAYGVIRGRRMEVSAKERIVRSLEGLMARGEFEAARRMVGYLARRQATKK